MRDEIYESEMRWTPLFSKTLHIFALNFGSVIKVMLLIFLPISLITSVIMSRSAADAAVLSKFLEAGTLLQDEAGMMAAAIRALGTQLIYAAVMLFLEPVGVIAVAKLARQRIDGEAISVKTAVMDAFQLEPTVIVSGIIYGAGVMLGSMAFMIPGIYLSIAWCLYLYCIGLGGSRGWKAILHSMTLTRGRWFRTAGYFICLSAVAYLWNLLFQWVIMGDVSIVKNVIYNFLCYFSGCFTATGMTMLFLNRNAVVLGVRPDSNIVDGTAEEKTDR